MPSAVVSMPSFLARVTIEAAMAALRLRGLVMSWITVRSIEPIAADEPVYNIEVHGQHVYEVTTDAILVHNPDDCDLLKNLLNKADKTAADKLEIDRLIAKLEANKS